MRPPEALQGVRMIKFRSVFERYEASELNQIDAAALLGVSERTFRRWCVRIDDDGEAGLLDRRLGRASGKRVAGSGNNRSRPCIGPATAASPPSTSMNT